MFSTIARLDARLGDLRGRIIDVHTHPTTDDVCMTAMAEQGRRAGVAKMILSDCGLEGYWGIGGGLAGLPRDPTPAQIQDYNGRGARLRDRFPDLYDIYAYVEPHHGPGAVRDVETWVRNQGAIGVKIVWCRWDDRWFEDTLAVVAKAAELRVPVLFHTFFRKGGVTEAEISPLDIAALAESCPDAQIIMAHFGGDWIRAARTVKPLPNVYGDTSGSTWRAGFTEFVARELGAERVLYGSDIGARAFGPQIAKVLAADLTRREKELIFVENARRLFYRQP